MQRMQRMQQMQRMHARARARARRVLPVWPAIAVVLAMAVVLVGVSLAQAHPILRRERESASAAATATTTSSAWPFSFSWDAPTSSWTIWWNDQAWLTSGDTYVHVAGTQYSVAEGTLEFVSSSQVATAGVDAIGAYNLTSITWRTTSTPPVTFDTNVRTYYTLNSAAPSSSAAAIASSPLRAIAFEQVYVNGAADAGTGNADGITSSFPSFVLDEAGAGIANPVPKWFFQWAGPFTWDTNTGAWNADAVFTNGRSGGPFVVFDQTATYCSMIAPLSHFMSTSSVVASNGSEIQMGVFGNASSVPAGFSTETLIMFGTNGIVDTVLKWGNALRARYNKQHSVTYADMALQYIGYTTDNGGYFYYNTEPDKDYQTTMFDVHSYLASANVPTRWMWFDSWFYYKDTTIKGVTNWTAMPSIFPDGLEYVHDKLQTPLIAHNRYWSAKNVYAKQNGGDYAFIIDGEHAAPLEQRFWNDLLGNASAWGLHTYEQDWLSIEFNGVSAFSYDVKLGRAWLLQMGEAARKYAITIQYCMGFTRHILQSVEIPAVTSFRASGDYLSAKGMDQWRIGDSSILGHAVGLAPYKDTFWTTAQQPGNPYNKTEESPALQTAVVTLSCAQVGLGDGLGLINQTLLHRVARTDGLVLKPDRPAMSHDRTFLYRSIGNAQLGWNGNVTHTFTQLSDQRWHVLMVADLLAANELTVDDLGPTSGADGTYTRAPAYIVHTFSEGGPGTEHLTWFDANTPYTLRACGRVDFHMIYAAPVLPMPAMPAASASASASASAPAPSSLFFDAITLLGDLSRWVPMSRQRVHAWAWSSATTLRVTLVGSPHESLLFSFAWTSLSTTAFSLANVRCRIDPHTEHAVVTLDLSTLAATCA